MLIDTHTHLVDEKFPNWWEVISRARDAGVERFVVPTTSLNNLDEAINKLKDVEGVFLLAGVHPEEVATVVGMTELISEMRERVVKNKKIVGIGEIGLDFYYDKEKKTKIKQVELFKAQLELAIELNLPVAIHMREAEKECLEVFKSLASLPKGQFHCFAGGEEFLKEILAWGFYVSFAGNLTYKSAHTLRERLKEVPLNRLLVETDSPYLAPEPVRGTINEPGNVKILAEFISKELNCSFEQISQTTSQNAECLYSLDI